MRDLCTDFIKYGPMFLKICASIALSPSRSYVHFGISVFCLITFQTCILPFGFDGLLSVDINNLENLIVFVGSW